ncbi:hypothetical protein GmHk_07G018929 [Glycine max]|nr:hypothetical protein GmHk_07G018929 [Glycine max]
MKSYMDSFDLWNVVEEDYEVSLLPENLSMAQIKHHREKKNQEGEGKDICWCFSNEEYEGDDHVRGMQVLNMMREFEEQKMKEFETIKRDLTKISLTEVIHSLQVRDKRRLTREESTVEGALPTKHQNATKYKKNKNFDGTQSSSTSTNAKGN